MNISNKIIGVVSAKGGVGKTTSVINIGAAASEILKKKVLILDTNLNTGNLGINLGITYHPASLQKIIRSNKAMLDSIYSHKSGLDIIPSSLDESRVNPKKLKERLRKLKYDLVLLDSAPGVGEDAKFVMEASDSLLLVTTPDMPAVSTSIKTINTAKKIGVPILGVIINRARGRKSEIRKERIKGILDMPIISIIPEDVNVNDAVASAMPVVFYKKRAPASISFKKLAAKLHGKKIKPSFLSKLAEMMKLRKFSV